MPRNLDIDKWIQIAKFTTTAGEMAPFPYIKGAAGCVTMILEAIEKAGKNDEDLQGLAEDIGTTMAIIKETIEVHGITSVTHFHDICADFQTYLENLLLELNKTQRNLERKRFHRFLKTRKVADVINGYKQRMNDIKANYVVSIMMDARLEMPKMRDILSTRITDAAEASRLSLTSTVNAQSYHIIDEIHSLQEIQREVRGHTSRIFANLQNRKGYFKGEVRDLAPGDIYLLGTEPHDYRHGYCTVESSNTVKLIRIYQPHIGNEGDVMKQLDHDIDVFVRPRHPNIAQVFGVCRSPNLPAIIFHGSMRVPVREYLDSVPVQDFIPFYIKFIRDIQSVSDHLAEYYALENSTDRNLTGAYINEHGRLLVVGIFRRYVVDRGDCTWRIVPFDRFWKQSIAEPWNPGRCCLRYISLVKMPRRDLAWAYHSMCHYVGKNHIQIPYEQGQHYVPGSILTVCGHTSIGGIRDRSRLCDWNVRWRGPHCSSENPTYSLIYLPSTDCGSIVVDPLVRPTSEFNFFEGNTIPILCAGTVPHYLQIYLRSSDEISKSWIAQASHLDTSLRSRGYIDEDGLYQIYGEFSLRIEPLDKHGEHFHLCDTFMAEDPHTLSLFIRPPVVDYPSNKVSSPVLSWLYDGDSEISLEEAENTFGFKLITSWELWPSPCSSVFTAISDLNAEYGFDPARGGTDVCERYGWPLLELFDTSMSMELEECTTSDAVSEPLEPELTIISDGARQTLREEVLLAGSPQENVTYIALERIEEVTADEGATKTKITLAVQRNMHPKYSELLIVVVTAISTLLLTLIVQVYLY